MIQFRQPAAEDHGSPAGAGSERRRWLSAGATLVYLAGISALLFGLFTGWAYDDPFITFRYAHNLANGAGFVYNPGEQVLSTTSALFVLLLAAVAKIVPEAHSYLPQIANLIGAICLACGGLLLWNLARASKAPAAAWAGLLLYPTFPAVVTTLGSEMPLYIALCLAAIAAYQARRRTWAAAFAALAALTRPDGILIAVLLAAHALYSARLLTLTNGSLTLTRRLSGFDWRPPVVFGAILLPWILFAWAYFGSPIPVTLAAKQLQGSMPISQRFLPGLVSLFVASLHRPYFDLEALLAAAGIGFYIWRGRQEQRRPGEQASAFTLQSGFVFVWLWAGAYVLGYTLLGVSRYPWYYAPLAAGWVLTAGLGLEAVTIAGRLARPAFRSIPVLLAVMMITPIFAGQIGSLLLVRQNPDRRMPAYKQAGEWLRANTPPEATVGTLEVGVIGYYAERPVIDFAGLIQPEVGRHLPGRSSYEDAARWAVKRYKPNFIVLREKLFPALEGDYILRKCRVVHTIPGNPQGYPWQIIIYACGKAGV